MGGSLARVKCAACSKRIREHEPDLILKDLDNNGARDRYYHSFCEVAAVRAAAEKPSVYVLTVRSVEPAVN